MAPVALTSRPAQLARLLNPSSVAVVGASRRPGWGLTTIENLDGVGFAGPVYPVNPRYDEIAGRECFASLGDLPAAPDAVVIAVPAAGIPAAVEEAIACDAGGAVVYASGFGARGEGEGGETGPGSLRARLAGICRGKQIALQGPNCLGMINYARRAALWGITMPFDHAGAESGAAVIAQSGNMALTLGGVNRGFSLTHLISCGNQLDVTAAELMSASLDDPAVRAVAVIAESIPDVPRFREALGQAADRDVPVVVLKVGTSERGRQAAIAHTGSLSGSAAIHRSFFRQFGAIQVEDLDELVATLAVLTAPRRPRRGGVAIFASSGGECGLSADVAAAAGVVLPDLPAAVGDELTALLPEYGHAANPLDLTAGGWGDAALYARVIEVLARGPVGTVVGIHDAPTIDEELASGWQGIIDGLGAGAERAGAAGVTVAGLSSQADLHPDVPRKLAARGVIPLAGLRPGLSALAKAGWYADWRNGRPASTGTTDSKAVRTAQSAANRADRQAAVRRLLDKRPPGPVPEDLAKQVLACYGIASPARELATSAEAAAGAAIRIGFPVALKVAAAGLHHKSDVGGVLLNLHSAEDVTAGAARLLALGRESDPAAAILVEQYVPGGLELIIGGRQDDAFGPLVIAGLGGVLTELLADVAHRLAPVNPAEAEAMLAELAGRRLLDGYRGQPGADVAAVASVIAAASSLLAEHPDIAELDINPLVAGPAAELAGPLALDALLVLRPLPGTDGA